MLCRIQKDIWLSTRNGVARWDSKNFQTFTIENGLPDNEVLFVFEDSRHRIWFSCNSDELSYYYKGKIYDKRTAPFLNKLRIAPGSKLDELNQELYFLSRKSILSKYNFRSGKITSFRPQHDLADFYFINDKRNIWAAENNLRRPNKLISPQNSESIIFKITTIVLR